MIRKATQADIPAVAAIYARVLEQESQGRTHTGWLPGIYPTADTAQAALRRGDLWVYDDGTVRASYILNDLQPDAYTGAPWSVEVPPERVWVMHTLAVDPLCFGQGIGRAMIDFYESEALSRGRPVLRIDTNATNQRARTIYARLGYREIGAVPCVFNGIPDVSLVLLEKIR